MKTISIINLKGGVAKTLTADSMAHVLATFHNKRVLLVDNDKQGNTSKAFGVHSYDDKSISDVLTARRMDPREVIKKTRFENIDVMPANMTLIRANMEVLMDSTRPQQTRLRSALNAIAEENFYDFCIIDNAPDINISTINALVASDDVIIPIKIDKYAFDGLEELKEQIEDTRDDLNPRLRLAGCLITCFIRADAEKQGEAWLRSRPEYPVFDTRIRYSDRAGTGGNGAMKQERVIAILDFYRDIDKTVTMNERVIRNLEDQYYSTLGAVNSDGMPRGKGGVSNPVERVVLNIPQSVSDTIANMRRENERLTVIKGEILSELNALNYREKAVIYGFYIDGLQWERLSQRVNYSPRQCRNIRNVALDRLAKRFEQNKQISRYVFPEK